MPKRRRGLNRKFLSGYLRSDTLPTFESLIRFFFVTIRYQELIPQLAPYTVSYNKTVESVRSVVSSTTSLESQSLIFAFGGPDLFFTRTSPSRGFDLLPDSFSRELVSFVTVGVVIALLVVKRMGSKKALKQGWQ